MSFFSLIKHWFTEAPHFEGVVVASERIGTRIQKVTIAMPSSLTERLFPAGCYIQTMAWGCIPRSYSVVIADKKSFSILVSFSGGGAGARFFRDASIGDKVTCYGPFDDFPYRYGTGRSKVFFATSTGVAPFCMMVEKAIEENVEAVLFLGSPKQSDIAFKDEFEKLSKEHSNFNFLPILSSPESSWVGARGYVTDQINDMKYFLNKSDIYICGIPIMTRSVLEALEDNGVPRNQIFVQKFG